MNRDYREILALTKRMPMVDPHKPAIVQDKQLRRQNTWLKAQGLSFDDIRQAYATFQS